MDIDQQVEHARKLIRKGDYVSARELLREAAKSAPFRTDIRELLAFALQQAEGQGSRTDSGGPPRRRPSRRPARRNRMPWRPILFVLGLLCLILLVGGGWIAVVRSERGLAWITRTPADPEQESEESGPDDPDDPSFDLADLNNRVEAMFSRSEFTQAIEALIAAAREHPDFAPQINARRARAELEWGKRLTGTQDFATAIVRLERAIELDPNLAEAHHLLGENLLARGRRAPRPSEAARDYEAAEKALREALRLDPEMTQSYYVLGRVYSAMIRPDRAAEAYRSVIRLAPDSVEAQRARDDLRMLDLR